MKKVLILQRAIPNYRLPLFQALCALPDVEITIGCAEHDEKTSTGIAADNYDGVRIRHLNIHRLGSKFLFQSLISVRPYDAIITDISINLLSMPVYALLCKLQGVKVIGWGKGVPQLLDVKERWVLKTYKKFVASCCDSLLLYGQISKTYFDALGFASKPMFVAQNSVHTEKFYNNLAANEAAAQQFKIDHQLGDRFVFGYFGKLTARKKVDSIIAAFRLVHASQPNAILIIAGGGADKQRLMQLSEDLVSKGAVKFIGNIPNGSEGAILHAMHAYLSFSQGGLGILEAMATGRTIVSTPEVFPETELLKGDYNCFLSKDFTVESFSKAMLKAIEKPVVALQMGSNAVITVKEKAGTAVMVNAFKAAINHTLSK